MLLMIVCINISKIYSISTKDLSHEKHPYIHICKHEKHSFLNIESWLEKLLLFWSRGLNEWIGMFRLNGIKKKEQSTPHDWKGCDLYIKHLGPLSWFTWPLRTETVYEIMYLLTGYQILHFYVFLGVEMKKCSSLIHSRWSADKT